MNHRIPGFLLLGLTACATTSSTSRLPETAPPLRLDTTAYEAAAKLELPKVEPQEYPGLHNVYRLSDNIISGSEPEGEEAIAKIAAMGVKTILTVDGKVPDHETAARYGVRYVHVPIRYSGLEEDELLKIAKTFREQEGPFYVHCFHGKHRGPAAAAVGRVILDGVPRDQAIAEMRQWCGTSKKYEGLYGTIALGDLPDANRTASYDYDFAPEFQFAGFRHTMVDMPRSFDTIADLAKRDWQVDPAHPDASAKNEARRLKGIFEASIATERTAQELPEFRAWLEESATASQQIADLLEAYEAGDQAAGEKAKQLVAQVKQACDDCHKAYRD